MRAANSFAGPVPNAWLDSVVPNLSAAGSTQGTATAIPSGQDCSIFTTVAASTGCILPASGVSIGEIYRVVNHGANALLVYPAVGGKIGTAATNAGFSLAAGTGLAFMFVGSLQWASGV